MDVAETGVSLSVADNNRGFRRSRGSNMIFLRGRIREVDITRFELFLDKSDDSVHELTEDSFNLQKKTMKNQTQHIRKKCPIMKQGSRL